MSRQLRQPPSAGTTHAAIVRPSSPPRPTSPVPRALLTGLGIALVLLGVEAVVWLIFVHSFTMLFQRLPLFLIALAAEVIVVVILALLAARPLALYRYTRDARRALEHYRAMYTPLPYWSAPYEANVIYYRVSPDPTAPVDTQEMPLVGMIKSPGLFQLDPREHLVLLGAPGVGKTTALHFFQYNALHQRRALLFGREKVPVYVPLRNYSLFIETQGTLYEQDNALTHDGARLLDFLVSSDLPGMQYLRPYLHKLFAQSRLLLLCDDLHEIDEVYQSRVVEELSDLMSVEQNRLVVTCREVDYWLHPQLAQVVEGHLLGRAVIQPYTQEQVRAATERFIEEDQSGRRWRHTAGQILTMISRTPLRIHCANPLLLVSLLSVAEGLGLDQCRRLNTRGRLLHAFVSFLVAQEARRPAGSANAPTEREMLLFLGEIACAARWSHAAHTLQLHKEQHFMLGFIPTPEDQADALLRWLDEHTQDMFLSDSLHEAYTHEEVKRLLTFARDATLIEVSPRGTLAFRHKLLAAAIVAAYFLTLTTSGSSALQDSPLIGLLAQAMQLQDRHDPFALWSLPITLWAGLLDDPVLYAARFAEYARTHAASRLDALALSLICLGVASPPPYMGEMRPVTLPPELASALEETLRDREECETLARLVTRHAEEGAYEIYSSLFELLSLEDIGALLPLLDMEAVPDLLFNRLRDIADDGAYDTQLKHLMRVVGSLGAAAVPRAAALSKPGAERSLRLRSTAITILGRTGEASAVAPLNACLYDGDKTIVGRASTALVRLGPALALPTLIRELENTSQTSATSHIHAAALRIIERFLEEQDDARQLTPAQQQQVMNTLSRMQGQGYAPDIQQQARALLINQGRTAGLREGGERAVEALAQNLASPDAAVADSAAQALCDIGEASTTVLLRMLEKGPDDNVCARIAGIFEKVRDPRAQAALLKLVSHPSLNVQQRVTRTLIAYAPDSIPGLIQLVLTASDEFVATRAEQILGDIGVPAVNPVMEALVPIVPERTHMLVNVLARTRDASALPVLIALLETENAPSLPPSQIDAPLILALIDALEQFQDERAVVPLMEVLTGSHALFYEAAINALSSLGALALDALLAALDVDGETTLTSRVERVVVGMEHFPGARLLDVFAGGTDAQAEHAIHIFVARGAEAAQFLTGQLFHPDARVRAYVRKTVEEMPGQDIVPPLLDIIHHPDPGWRAVASEMLLRHPQEAMPPLVGLLDDNERGAAAQSLLLQFGADALPALVVGLDSLNNLAQGRARKVVVELARQSPENLAQVAHLFTLSPPPPPRAHDALISILANELADISVPVLLQGLGDAYLVGDMEEALVSMVRKGDARGEAVLEELLLSLRDEQRRHGASLTLVEIGEKAVPGVGSLITDPDAQVAHSARRILGEIGPAAFSFIWAAYSDMSNRARREAARDIFRRMPTGNIKDALVDLLSSDEQEKITMALVLLLGRIHDEDGQPGHEHEMIPVLLEHVQTHSDQRASQRIMALLLLLGGRPLGGRTVVDFIAQVLYDYPNHQQRFLHALLLLGDDAGETLFDILHDADAPATLRAEAAGTLGMLSPYADIREYAKMLAEYGLWAGQSQGRHDILQVEQLNVSLRALGGLLAGGYWQADELQRLRLHSKEGSPERELYEILLGWRYTPHIETLEHELETERKEHRLHVQRLGEEIMSLHADKDDLQQEIEVMRLEHNKRGQELDEAAQTLSEHQQALRQAQQRHSRAEEDLRSLEHENHQLQSQLAEVNQEKAYAEARLRQLEQNLRNLTGQGGQQQR